MEVRWNWKDVSYIREKAGKDAREPEPEMAAFVGHKKTGPFRTRLPPH